MHAGPIEHDVWGRTHQPRPGSRRRGDREGPADAKKVGWLLVARAVPRRARRYRRSGLSRGRSIAESAEAAPSRRNRLTSNCSTAMKADTTAPMTAAVTWRSSTSLMTGVGAQRQRSADPRLRPLGLTGRRHCWRPSGRHAK